MLPSKALLSLVLIGLSVVSATPVTRNMGKSTLSFATKFNTGGPLNIAEKDRARAQALKNVGYLGKRSGGMNATNAAVAYTAQVGIGSPATEYTLLIDTGSSNTWVGAGRAYVKTNTSRDTGNTVFLPYGSGLLFGEEYTDTVTLSSDLVISEQSIGVAILSFGLSGYDGILGVGPVDLTLGTVGNTLSVPTVTDNLYLQGTISQAVLGIYYVPASEVDSGGTLTFGGVDESVTTSSLQYIPLTTTFPANMYWGIDLSISYGGDTILSKTAGVVDTGTTLVLIASNAFNVYQNATGGTYDLATGLLKITSDQYANLETLFFDIGGTSYALSPNAQIWPRSLNTAIGGTAGSIYLVVSDIGTPSGSGLDFIMGYAFLERYYSVFDTTNNRVGFAFTGFTESTSN